MAVQLLRRGFPCMLLVLLGLLHLTMAHGGQRSSRTGGRQAGGRGGSNRFGLGSSNRAQPHSLGRSGHTDNSPGARGMPKIGSRQYSTKTQTGNYQFGSAGGSNFAGAGRSYGRPHGKVGGGRGAGRG